MNLEIPNIINGVDKNDIQTPPHDSLPMIDIVQKVHQHHNMVIINQIEMLP